MADVEIVSEAEEPGGWTFRLRLADGAGGSLGRTLRLSWADYNLWSGDGADPPHAVALAAARFVLSRTGAEGFPGSLDASVARRRFPGADEEIPRLIAQG